MIYKFKGDTKNAKAYAKKAFYNLPKNAFHISEYMKIIRETEDIDELEAAFKLLTRNDNLNGWKPSNSALAAKSPTPPTRTSTTKGIVWKPSNRSPGHW